MKAVTISSCLVVGLLAILHMAVSLPPDFFRSGRGQMSGEKRAVQEYEIMRGVCSYCGLELGDEFELGCRTGKPSIRKQCALSHYNFVESLMEKNGWK